MGKIKKLFLFHESKEIIKLVWDKNNFSLIGDAGVSDDYSEEEIVDLFNKLKVPSSDELIQKAKDVKTHQVEFEIESKNIKQLNLK